MLKLSDISRVRDRRRHHSYLFLDYQVTKPRVHNRNPILQTATESHHAQCCSSLPTSTWVPRYRQDGLQQHHTTAVGLEHEHHHCPYRSCIHGWHGSGRMGIVTSLCSPRFALTVNNARIRLLTSMQAQHRLPAGVPPLRARTTWRWAPRRAPRRARCSSMGHDATTQPATHSRQGRMKSSVSFDASCLPLRTRASVPQHVPCVIT